MSDDREITPERAGVIDPTKNVLDLVRAEATKRDEFRVTDEKLIDAKIETLRAEQRVLQATTDGQANLQSWMRDSESKRLDQLSALRETYEKRIADMLSDSVRSTSSLISDQLKQIQATFDARVAKLEEFRLLSTGRSSVADPQTATSLAELSSAIAKLQSTGTSLEGRGIAVREVIGWIFGVIGAVALIITAFYTMHTPSSIQPTVQYVPAPTAVPNAPAPITVPR